MVICILFYLKNSFDPYNSSVNQCIRKFISVYQLPIVQRFKKLKPFSLMSDPLWSLDTTKKQSVKEYFISVSIRISLPPYQLSCSFPWIK